VPHKPHTSLLGFPEFGGGLSFVWEGNLPIEDAGGVSGKYKDVSIIIASQYARWH